jgi:hypothetical protein
MAEKVIRRAVIRLPGDVADFIDREAEKNCASRNSEIVRSIRKRMESEQRAAG